MYARQVEGEVHTFGVSGKLIRNGLVMYDRESDTLWSQVLGEAIAGRFKGTQLEIIPSLQTQWATWKELHPDTLVLDKMGGYQTDPYDSYYRSGSAGNSGRTLADDRLYIKEYVIGVSFLGDAKAYPFGVLNDNPVVNDTVGDRDILVVFDVETGSGAVFDRRVEGKTLHFSLAEGSSPTGPMLIDRETQTRWSGLAGEATEGELKGKSLSRLPSTYAFWFGWKDYHPSTELYGID